MPAKNINFCLIQGLTYFRIVKEDNSIVKDGEIVNKKYKITHIIKSDIPLDVRTINILRNNPEKLNYDDKRETRDN